MNRTTIWDDGDGLSAPLPPSLSQAMALATFGLKGPALSME